MKAIVTLIAAAITLTGCAWPTRDPAKLEAISREAETLMTAYLPTADVSVPKNRWPHAIASLEPEFVSVDPDGVHITTKVYFDGGWGYFVLRKGRRLPEPAGRLESIGHGVYWWRPY